MFERLIDLATSIPPAGIVVGVFLLSACETAFVFGFVLPGELTVFLGGTAAAGDAVPLPAVCLAATLGPFAGDIVGYFVGRNRGHELLEKRFPKSWSKAEKLVERSGPAAVFLGRFAPVFRTVLPLAAGSARMAPSRFVRSAAAAALVWGIGSTLLGYAAVKSFSGGGFLTHASWGVAAVAIGGLFVFAHRYLSRDETKGAQKKTRAG